MEQSVLFIVKCLYLILPGILANMIPVLVKKNFNFLARPVDFNLKWRDGESILGNHKTWRGLFFGTLSAILVVAIQKTLFDYEFFRNISLFPYQEHSFWSAGFLIGFGVLFGDMVKSFFKRRLKIKPGDKFIPWDQLDAVLGGLIFISIIWQPPWLLVITLVVLSFTTHIVIRHLGYYLKINDGKW